MIIDGVQIHPTLRIGFPKVGISGRGDEFITEKPCGESESLCVVLASCEAIDAIQARQPGQFQESVFLCSIGIDPSYTVFISESEYEVNLLYPSE